jgi:hypothetical protein
MRMLLVLLAAAVPTFLLAPVAAQVQPADSAAGYKDELKKLLDAKIPEQTIISYIRGRGPAPMLSASDFADLRNAGASDAVLLAIVESAAPKATPPNDQPYVPPQDSGTTYSYDYYPYGYSYPYYYPYSYYPYYPYYPYPYSAFYFGFGVPFHSHVDHVHHFDNHVHGVGPFRDGHGTPPPAPAPHGGMQGHGSSGGGGFHGGAGGHH